MMKDGTMSVMDAEEDLNQIQESSPVEEQEVEEDDESLDESQDESMPFENMQTELHSKGAVLTRAWSDLFSFITKYQAELVVKENSVEISQKEIEQRKKQLEEMKPDVDAGNEEVSKLQDEIQTKERLLSNAQSQLSVKERMMQRMQSDLSCNMDLLEKTRSELLGKQSELVRYRGDLERLKSELTIKQEQILIKDNLLKKLQNQLMKENAELKEQLELERRALELEKRSHELTKRSIVSQGASESRKRQRTRDSAAVIEIPDSPPTLDLSVEQGDFGLSNIISLTESQSTALDSFNHRRYSSSTSTGVDTSRISSSMSAPSPSFTENSSRFHHHTPANTAPSQYGFSTPPKVSRSPSQFMASPSITPPRTSFPSVSDNSDNPTAMTSSEAFFPLSVEDTKPDLDYLSSTMHSDTDNIQGSMPLTKPGTPSSTTSDSNQGPIPISGPIPSPGMSPGGSMEGGADGKYPLGYMNPLLLGTSPHLGNKRCHFCGHFSTTPQSLKVHMRRHTGERPFKCSTCGQAFAHRSAMKTHYRIHTGERPYSCKLCEKTFITLGHLRSHQVSRHGGLPCTPEKQS